MPGHLLAQGLAEHAGAVLGQRVDAVAVTGGPPAPELMLTMSATWRGPSPAARSKGYRVRARVALSMRSPRSSTLALR